MLTRYRAALAAILVFSSSGLAQSPPSAIRRVCAPAGALGVSPPPSCSRGNVLPNAVSDSTFLRDYDGRLAIATVLATGTLAVFDERIARWFRQPSVQDGESRHDLADALTVINEQPLTIGAIAVYGVGKIGRWHVVADVGAHLTASLLATEVASGLIRVGLGRTRPRASPNDAFRFEPFSGFSNFDNRSFPSLHAAVAFATAAAIDEELRVRNVNARTYVAPLLYAAATIPGFTRLYLDQHWASDILAGSVIGAYVGKRMVRYAHTRRTILDRLALDARLDPASRNVMVVVTVPIGGPGSRNTRTQGMQMLADR